MHKNEFAEVDIASIQDEVQRCLIEVLADIDLLADEAEAKSDLQMDRHRIMFYRGVMFGLEIAHNEIARHLYRAVRASIAQDSHLELNDPQK